MTTTETQQMNYLALADWIESVAEGEKLGPPWETGSTPKGIGAIIDVGEPMLTNAIYQVGMRCDWFTRSTFITSFLEYLRNNPRLEVQLQKE